MKQLDEAAATTLEALASRWATRPLASSAAGASRAMPARRAGSDDGDQPLEGVKDQDAEQ